MLLPSLLIHKSLPAPPALSAACRVFVEDTELCVLESSPSWDFTDCTPVSLFWRVSVPIFPTHWLDKEVQPNSGTFGGVLQENIMGGIVRSYQKAHESWLSLFSVIMRSRL